MIITPGHKEGMKESQSNSTGSRFFECFLDIALSRGVMFSPKILHNRYQLSSGEVNGMVEAVYLS